MFHDILSDLSFFDCKKKQFYEVNTDKIRQVKLYCHQFSYSNDTILNPNFNLRCSLVNTKEMDIKEQKSYVLSYHRRGNIH